MFEIITSEYSYMHSLNVLVCHFMRSEELRETMTQTEHHHLFSNISDILTVSTRQVGAIGVGLGPGRAGGGPWSSICLPGENNRPLGCDGAEIPRAFLPRARGTARSHVTGSGPACLGKDGLLPRQLFGFSWL